MPDSATRVLKFSRDWAGLCQSGRILVSIDRIVHGDTLDGILAHETAHDVLLKSTQLGWVLLALSPSALDPYPPGPLRDRCARLLEAGILASRFTQEAVATFLPSLTVEDTELAAYRARHPREYLDAADALEWLRARDLPPETKRELVLTIGKLALSVPVLDAWRPQRLHRPERAEHWFHTPRNRPDRRFPALCRALRDQPDEVLRSMAAGEPAAAARLCDQVRVDGKPFPYGWVPADAPSPAWLDGLVRDVIRPLITDPSLPQQERDRLETMWEQPTATMPGLQPAMMSVLLTYTTSTHGMIEVNPPTDGLHGYPLVEVQHNALPLPVPGVEPLGTDPMWLHQGETALWFISPWKDNRACHLSPPWLREWLDELDDDTTLCLRDGADLAGILLDDPRLARRRRVVLLQHRTPHWALFIELPVTGLDERRGPVTMTVANSELDGVAYLMLRPECSSPVVIVPTARTTAVRAARALQAERGRIRFSLVDLPTFLTSDAMTRDVMRVLHNFEAKPWPETLKPPVPPAPRRPTRADAEAAMDAPAAQMAEACDAFEAAPTAETFAVVAETVEATLACPSLPSVSLGWRIWFLDNAVRRFCAGYEKLADPDALRRAIEIQSDLLDLLPADWPERADCERTLRRLVIRGYAAAGAGDKPEKWGALLWLLAAELSDRPR
ncbi:hypothetical protein QZH56_35330 [Streptomyces olivoreticuli]|uniref:hypothetical protein n=1 Tax=Streptomyces olivoreticuli TaxID=68246 RepID=UPI00265ABD06|nr:hypothetical protein [Streptomyces olivoreticuli]WKK23904.1 hypothetical protein QZH56_35330 [Streptomyces olivoreticuli]